MQYDDFMKAVQGNVRAASIGEAVSATRATLETLGERLPEGASKNLAGQLPREVGLYLERSPYQDNFDLQEFYKRVMEKSSLSIEYPDAVHEARSVMAVVVEAVGDGEARKVRSDLGADYAELFELVAAE
jgi:uncharacterized protein (DUF2267 family)